MPRLTTQARLQQKWFRFKKWLRFRFGPRPKLTLGTPCPECGSDVVHGVDTHVDGNNIIAVTGFRCVKCAWRPPTDKPAIT